MKLHGGQSLSNHTGVLRCENAKSVDRKQMPMSKHVFVRRICASENYLSNSLMRIDLIVM